MKPLAIIVLALMLSYATTAQEETLIKGKIESGGYGGPMLKVGQLNGKTTLFVGGQGGWIINHRLVIGGKGYASVVPADVDGLQNIVVGFVATGAFFEYIMAFHKLFHVSVENMIGYGVAYNDLRNNRKEPDPIDYTEDGGFLMEPGVNFTLNVSKMFRIGAGVSYRFVSGVNYDPGAPYQNANAMNYEAVTNSDVSGLSAQIVFKIGNF